LQVLVSHRRSDKQAASRQLAQALKLCVGSERKLSDHIGFDVIQEPLSEFVDELEGAPDLPERAYSDR
jgi:hypothetical protein